MKFISTRGKSPAVTAAEAIRRGLAPDGGLYVPDELPAFSASELEALYALPYAELSAAVLERFLPGFSREELLEYTKKAYASFDDDAVVPLHALGDKLWTMELFHGPTCAFKDVALQILPYLLAASVRKCADDHTVAILVATSGDTGKAALEGFADVPGTKIAVFYPDGGVSDIQRAQMATQGGNNVLVLAVRGNFDDAQTGVKDIFADAALASELDRAGVVLSSANSINWGRLAADRVLLCRLCPAPARGRRRSGRARGLLRADRQLRRYSCRILCQARRSPGRKAVVRLEQQQRADGLPAHGRIR